MEKLDEDLKYFGHVIIYGTKDNENMMDIINKVTKRLSLADIYNIEPSLRKERWGNIKNFKFGPAIVYDLNSKRYDYGFKMQCYSDVPLIDFCNNLATDKDLCVKYRYYCENYQIAGETHCDADQVIVQKCINPNCEDFKKILNKLDIKDEDVPTVISINDLKKN